MNPSGARPLVIGELQVLTEWQPLEQQDIIGLGGGDAWLGCPMHVWLLRRQAGEKTPYGVYRVQPIMPPQVA